jgi:hypothetical protein
VHFGKPARSPGATDPSASSSPMQSYPIATVRSAARFGNWPPVRADSVCRDGSRGGAPTRVRLLNANAEVLQAGGVPTWSNSFGSDIGHTRGNER